MRCRRAGGMNCALSVDGIGPLLRYAGGGLGKGFGRGAHPILFAATGLQCNTANDSEGHAMRQNAHPGPPAGVSEEGMVAYECTAIRLFLLSPTHWSNFVRPWFLRCRSTH